MARHTALPHHVSPTSISTIRQVGTDRPWIWLAEAWGDMARYPGVSLWYGFIVTTVMVVVFVLLQSIHYYALAFGVMAGFALLGPVLAVGLYEACHRWKRNTRSTLGVGLVLVLLLLSWFMLAMQLTAVMVGLSDTVLGQIGAGSMVEFAGSTGWPWLVSFSLTGLLFAVVVFMLTAVSIPLLIDEEDMDMITAMATSYHAVVQNWRAMLVWALLIGFFTTLAVIPLFLGLIVTFPLLAYATWHAYRDIIGA